MGEQQVQRMTSEQRITALAQRFPCHRDILGDGAWNAQNLIRRHGTASSGERHAISFLLTIWNIDQDWVPKFNVAEAMTTWDNGHRRAFAEWVASPFFC